MMTLITGRPGNGKTLLATDKYILQELEEQVKKIAKGERTFDYLVGEEVIQDSTNITNDEKSVLKKQVYRSLDVERPIYSDINGLNITNVRPIPDDNYDYRQFPKGSIIIYDEAQRRDSFKASRTQPDDIVTSLQTHRHHGYDIIFITQSPSFLNKYVKDLIGHHVHLKSLVKGRSSVGYEWSECQDNPSSETAKRICENKFTYFYPKRIFGMYKSTVVDTHRQSLVATLMYHKWKIAPFAFAAVAISYSLFTGANSSFFQFSTEEKKKKIL